MQNWALERFRHELLEVRRRMLSLSQTELATLTGLAQGTLSKLEQGLKPVTAEQVQLLADYLNCPPSFFFQPERLYGAPISSHPMYRKKMSTGVKVLDRLTAELNVRISHIRTFLKMIDLQAELPFPQYDVEDYEGGAVEIAGMIRRAWYAPRGPLSNLTEFAERAGILVVHLDMEDAKLDGVSYRVPGLPPLVFLNKNQPGDRMRFTLAHELGHLVMHPYPTAEMEAEADSFASALLMPEADIRADLQGLTLEKAARLKPYWKVSMGALIMRAKNLATVEPAKLDYLWRQMSLKGYRMREPASLDLDPERPSVMPGLLANVTGPIGYDETDLVGALHLHYDELAKLYDLKPLSKLRLVSSQTR